jgi:hypothetical protein
MAGAAGRGRKSKGERTTLIVRVATPLSEVVRARANEAGLSISDYAGALIARAHDLPQYAEPPWTGLDAQAPAEAAAEASRNGQEAPAQQSA